MTGWIEDGVAVRALFVRGLAGFSVSFASLLALALLIVSVHQ